MDDTTIETSQRGTLRAVWDRRLVVLLCVVLTVAPALIVAARTTPTFEASSHLRITDADEDAVFRPAERSGQGGTEIATQMEVLRSDFLEDEVKKRLRLSDEAIKEAKVSALPESQVVKITVVSEKKDVAAKAANTFAEAYVDKRRKERVDRAVARALELRRQSLALQRQIDDLNKQIGVEVLRLERLGPDTSVLLDSLRARLAEISKRADTFNLRAEEYDVEARLAHGGAELVVPASAPEGPANPRPLRTTVLAGLLGLVLGVGLALLFELVDDRIRSREDLARAAEGIPLLGTIPRAPRFFGHKRSEHKGSEIAILDQPTSLTAEAYSALHANLQFIGQREATRVLLMSSPVSGDGKTTNAINLAATLARFGGRVVVMCCDLRTQGLTALLGLGARQAGVLSVLGGTVGLDAALHEIKVPGRGSLHVLPAGGMAPNPLESLRSEEFSRLMKQLRNRFDAVLLDAPPLLPVADTLVISQHADTVLISVAAHHTRRSQLRAAVERLMAVNIPVVGIVLNRFTDLEQKHYPARGRPPASSDEVIIPTEDHRPSGDGQRPVTSPAAIAPATADARPTDQHRAATVVPSPTAPESDTPPAATVEPARSGQDDPPVAPSQSAPGVLRAGHEGLERTTVSHSVAADSVRPPASDAAQDAPREGGGARHVRQENTRPPSTGPEPVPPSGDFVGHNIAFLWDAGGIQELSNQPLLSASPSTTSTVPAETNESESG